MALNKDNNFLQSDIWRKFQEAVGCRTFYLELKSPSNPPFEKGEGLGFSASIVEHQLSVVGKYFYIPRGPIIGISNDQIPTLPTGRQAYNQIPNPTLPTGRQESKINLLIDLAKKENAGWVRVDPDNNQALELIKNNISLPIKKAPHDMQPREILVMDIFKSEEELLSGMKSKTRYNIKLAEKHGVSVFSISNPPNYLISNQIPNPNDKISKYIAEFIRLIKLTEKRKDIRFHSANYYQKMLEVIPGDILKLYVAEYNDKVIAANLVIFFGDTATYLHGATDDEYRNVMAPYLLQWQAIKDAKASGCKFYDLGGIKTVERSDLTPTLSLIRRGSKGEGNSWSGITKFKTGFAPNTEPIKFLGSFDLVINAPRYLIYRIFSRLRNIFSFIG